MKYSYQIAGRSYARIEQTIYMGETTAATPKAAILSALASEFGARVGRVVDGKRIDDDLQAIVDSGWTDQSLFLEQYNAVDDEDTRFQYDAEEHSFVVEVKPIAIPTDAEMKNWWDFLGPQEQCLNAAAVAEQMGCTPEQIVKAVERPSFWYREAYYHTHGLDPDNAEDDHPDLIKEPG